MKMRLQKKTSKPQRMRKRNALRLRGKRTKKPPDWLPRGLQMAKVKQRKKKLLQMDLKMNEICI